MSLIVQHNSTAHHNDAGGNEHAKNARVDLLGGHFMPCLIKSSVFASYTV